MQFDRYACGIGESLFAEMDRAAKGTGRRLASYGAGLLGDRGCCFTFHRLASSADWPGLPNRDFYLDAGFLARLLAYLKQTGWAIVSMEDALHRSAQPHGGRFVNFSVDDCYRDTVEAVVPLFRCFGAPITLFVQTGVPDGMVWLWQAGLETILHERAAVTDAGVTYVLNTPLAKRAAFQAISRRWEAGAAEPEYLRFCARYDYDPVALEARHALTWEMLDELRDDPLVEIGAHTISHPHVSRLSPDEAVQEMEGSRLRLEHRLQHRVRHFAFPFGRRADCGPRDFALAREAGFISAATTRKGLLRPGRDPFRIPRNTLNGGHRKLLLAEGHLSGLSGVAARMLGRV